MTSTLTDAPSPVVDRTGEVVLSAWSVVSPFGVGREVFDAGVLSGQSAIGPLDHGTYPGPFDRAGLVPGFTAAKYLGVKGTRLMDRLTALAVTAVGGLVEQCEGELASDPERAALVLGTGWAGVQSIMDTTRDSLVGEKPYHVDPAKFPNTVMNKAAGQSAIWHRIKGPNTTITGDWLTGLLALSYAIRLLRGGHCDRVLCGAVEEYSVQRAWLEWHAAPAEDRSRLDLGEGAAFFLVEPLADARRAGRTPLVRVLATRFMAFSEPEGAGKALADCVRAALGQARASARDVRIVAPSSAGGEVGEFERNAILDVIGTGDPQWIECRSLVGDTSSVSTGFQTAAVLAAVRANDFGASDLALVTAIDRDGTVGCALLGGCEATP
jgi:3-oxoacyl-[acyl-carrier-protein] synthase II